MFEGVLNDSAGIGMQRDRAQRCFRCSSVFCFNPDQTELDFLVVCGIAVFVVRLVNLQLVDVQISAGEAEINN